MRLTKDDKAAFVRAVMNDVPNTDFQAQARKLVEATIYEAMPEKVRAVFDDKDMRRYIECTSIIYTPGSFSSVCAYGGHPFSGYGIRDKCPVLWAELQDLERKAYEQAVAHDALRRKIAGMIEPISTLKKARVRLPEFAKYLPAERDTTGTTNLPIANVVTDLVSAGWPKGSANSSQAKESA